MATSGTLKWRLKQLITDRLIDIATSENSMVGRNCDARICLKSNKSSRTHAAFVVNVEGNLLVQDLKSVNGTFVNGTQIPVYILHRVFPGDNISFGLADITLAEDDRDKQCFFQVLLVEQLPVTDQSMEGGAIADSTTEMRENSISTNCPFTSKGSDVMQPDSVGLNSKPDKNHKFDDVIDISSSTSDNEVDHIAELRIAKVCSLPEDEARPKTAIKSNAKANLFKEQKESKLRPLNCSLESIKVTKNLPVRKLSSRRCTIQVETSEYQVPPVPKGPPVPKSKQSLIKTRSCQKDITSNLRTSELNNTDKLTKKTSENDSDELILPSNKIIPKVNGQLLQSKEMTIKSPMELKKAELSKPNTRKDKLPMEPRKTEPSKPNTRKDVGERLKSNQTDLTYSNSKEHLHSNYISHEPKGAAAKGSTSKCLGEQERLSNPEFGDISAVAKTDKNFTTDKDNSFIIDITDDNDDDMDFSCSQIFQMSQFVKTEAPDDKYQKIKNELAEMDFCNEEMILNTVPINLEDEFDTSGFENTQDICEFLQDGIEGGSKDAATKPTTNQSSDSVDVTSMNNEKTGHDLLTAKASTSCTANNQNNSDTSNHIQMTAKSDSGTNKRKSSIPPIIEPHTIIKPEKKIRQSPRKKKSDALKVVKINNEKRKSSMEAPIDKKKSKSNPKSPMNPLKYDSKDIASEFKKRRSTSIDMDKAEKVNIREERRKKLKELASSSTSKSGDCSPEDSSSDISKTEINSGIKKGCKEYVSTTRGSSSVAAVQNGTIAKAAGPKKVVADNNVKRNSKPVELPPPSSSYNLRRAKSSDDIKIRRPNADAVQNRPLTRHSTSADVRGQSTTSANVPNLRPKVIPTTQIHPRTAPSTLIQKPSYLKPSYPTNVYPQETSRRLMWNNGAPARRPVFRRLVNVDDITKKVVQWLPKWLEEQVYTDCCPPVNNPPAMKIPFSFENFNQYYDTFSKLVLLENWQYLFKGFQEGVEQPRRVKIEHVRFSNDLMTLDCVCYITRQELRQGFFYRAEDVILFESVINDKDNCYMSLNFGLIQNSRKTVIPNNALISIRLGDLCPGDPHTKLEFTVLTRYQPNKEINTRRTPIVKVLANIRGHLMLIRAIKGIEHSPLCFMILNPKMSDYKFTVTHNEITHPHNLSLQQKAIVLEAASLCTGEKHGIYCVKGPPGTGKSTVVVNLIFQILFSHRYARNPGKPPMILLAAPSNTAVDNLISKLVTIKHSLVPELRHQIKLVRIGPESSISKEVIGYSLPKLAENHVPMKNIEIPEIKAARDRNENMIEFTKAFFGDQYPHELKMCENLIIDKSNIICTTLNSCINGRLIDAVNRGLIEFTCCIIDEATQCHEVEALLPTILGINKLVLVGDPQQLNATIMSRDALRLGFGQSLFTRLANNFGNDPRTPIKMLTEQYRMHPEICAFPNKQFYEGKLRSFPKHVNKLPEEIRPYLVFNCEKVTPSMDYTNMDEIFLIKILLSTIFGMVNRNYKYTVGIITPYNAQKDLICSNIADLTVENENCKITTNTVDSFQGSEFDIVIISCVRDSSNSFLQNENRLNVALTRAKQALYIIGNYTLFKECRPLYDLREDAKRRKVLLDIKQTPRSLSNFNKYLIRRNSSSKEQSL